MNILTDQEAQVQASVSTFSDTIDARDAERAAAASAWASRKGEVTA